MTKAEGLAFHPAFCSPEMHLRCISPPRKGSAGYFLPVHLTPNQGQSPRSCDAYVKIESQNHLGWKITKSNHQPDLLSLITKPYPLVPHPHISKIPPRIHLILYHYLPIETNLCFYLVCTPPSLQSYTALLHKGPVKMRHCTNILSYVAVKDRDSPKLRCPTATLSSVCKRKYTPQFSVFPLC